MIKTYDLVDQSITLAPTSAPFSYSILASNQAIIVYGGLYLVGFKRYNGSNYQIRYLGYNSDWSYNSEAPLSDSVATMNGASMSITTDPSNNLQCGCLWNNGTDSYIQNQGATTTTYTSIIITGIQIFYIGTDMYVAAYSTNRLDFFKNNMGSPDYSFNAVATVSDSGGTYTFTQGYTESNIYYYIRKEGTIYKIRSFNGTVLADSETLTLGTTAALDYNKGFLIKQGTTRILGWGSCLWYYENVWKEVIIGVTADPIPHWYLDTTLKIRSITFGIKNIVVGRYGNALFRPISTAPTGYCAWDDYLIDSDKKVWKFALVSTAPVIKNLIVPDVVLSMPKTIIMETSIEPITRQYYQIFNDSSVLEYQGYCSEYKYDFQKYVCKMENPAAYDLDTAITYTANSKTVHYIMKDIIDTYCSWLTYGASTISTTPTETYTKTWKNTTIFKIFNELAQSEGYWWSIAPNFEVSYQRGIASGITVDDTTDGIIGKPLVEKYPLPRSHYYLEGKWNPTTSSRDYLEDFVDANDALYYDQFPAANIADLTKILVGLKVLTNLENIKASFAIHNKALFVGMSFTLTLTAYSITADTYYIQEVKRDILNNNVGIVCTSAISIPKKAPEEQTEERLVNLEDNLDDTNTRVDAKLATTTAASTYAPLASPALTGTPTMNGYNMNTLILINTDAVNWHGCYYSSTNAVTVELDLVNGGCANKDANITEYIAAAAIVPSGTKAVFLKLYLNNTNVNDGNGVRVYMNGLSNFFQNLQAIGLIYYPTQGIVSLDANGHIKLYFNRASGTVYCYLHVVGYWI